MTAGVDGPVEPDDAALDNLRDRRPGVFGDGVPVPAVDHARRRTRSGACPVTGIRILLSFADNSGAAQMRPTIHKNGLNAGVLLGEDAEWSVMGLPYLKVLLLKKNSVGIGIR